MTNHRSLSVEEIDAMERQGCQAQDWTRVSVSEGFDTAYIRNVTFGGDVALGLFDGFVEAAEGVRRHSGISHATLIDCTVGDNCLIENIGSHLLRCDIGEECYLSNVGLIATTEGATYGQGVALSVMNEGGDGNVVLCDALSSQLADLMVRCARDKEAWPSLRAMAEDYADGRRPERSLVGYRVRIVGARELTNVCIGDDCEICGASRLADVTLVSTPEASTYVGHDTIIDCSVLQAGASVADGAKIANCFVGEACHVGRGFSAESSLFFANSYMDNGEACAAFCGPFSVSHHKSTLLIGGQCSFYNAGSATNFSNHAYKLGPIHYGTLRRGSKTASGSHVLWPATIGAFSVCIGKIENHPDTSALPFSYVIGTPAGTLLVPGRNLATVGTCRDTRKWPRRDLRPRTGRQSLVVHDWLSPYVVQDVLRGRKVLETLMAEQAGQDIYIYNECRIKARWAEQGLRLYDLALRLFMGEAIRGHYGELPEGAVGAGEWTELCGLPCPEAEVERIVDDIRSGEIDELQLVADRLITLHDDYQAHKWSYAYTTITAHLGIDTLTADDLRDIEADALQAQAEWKDAVCRDAEREYELGDVDEATLQAFLEKL